MVEISKGIRKLIEEAKQCVRDYNSYEQYGESCYDAHRELNIFFSSPIIFEYENDEISEIIEIEVDDVEFYNMSDEERENLIEDFVLDCEDKFKIMMENMEDKQK